MKFGEEIIKNWKLVKPLSDDTYLVTKDGTKLNVLRVISYPRKPGDIFEYLAKNLKLDEIDEATKKEAQNLVSLMEKLNHASVNSHMEKNADFFMEKIPGSTGWRIIKVEEPKLNLYDYLKYHSMKEKEVKVFGLQIAEALKTLLQAESFHGCIHPGNIFALKDGEFILADYALPYHKNEAKNKTFLSLDKKPDIKSDLYSLGKIMLYLSNKSLDEIEDPALKEAIEKLTKEDPNTRIQDPWVLEKLLQA